jgi:alkylation response protein AidB-like acyl-CoA dehydrogenase
VDFELTDEQELIREAVREFAESELAPIAAELDRDHRFPEEILPKLADLNLMGMPYPEKVGGAGADYVSYVIAIEEISRACASTGIIVSAHASLATWPVYRFGTEAQKERYLSDMASGRRLGAFALTEPAAGTDAGAGTTTAVLSRDEYVLNGTKMFITNAPFAEVYIVFAKTDPAQGTRGMSAFIVEKDTPGFSVGEAEHKLGIRGSSTPPIYFADCRVQDSYANARRRADRGLGAGAGHRSGGARRIGRLREGACPVRQADRDPPGYSVDDRGYGDRSRRGPAPSLSRRIVRGQWPPVFHGRGDGQAVRIGDCYQGG